MASVINFKYYMSLKSLYLKPQTCLTKKKNQFFLLIKETYCALMKKDKMINFMLIILKLYGLVKSAIGF